MLKAKMIVCVAALCELAVSFCPTLSWKVWSTSKPPHIWFWVEGRGQVEAGGLHFSSRGMSEGSERLVAMQKPSPHSREINQSLQEHNCHFLNECWKISTTINLSRSSSWVLTSTKLTLAEGKASCLRVYFKTLTAVYSCNRCLQVILPSNK